MALAELGDLGRTDEREVHGPAEDHQPLAREALVRHPRELMIPLQTHRGLQIEVGKAVTDRQHGSSPLSVSFFQLVSGARLRWPGGALSIHPAFGMHVDGQRLPAPAIERIALGKSDGAPRIHGARRQTTAAEMNERLLVE